DTRPGAPGLRVRPRVSWPRLGGSAAAARTAGRVRARRGPQPGRRHTRIRGARAAAAVVALRDPAVPRHCGVPAVRARAASPARRGGARMNDDAAASVVPVLLYHAVGTDRSDWIAPYTVTVPTFRRHLELVAASGRVALSVEELRLAMIGELRLSCPAVVITFDDGFVELADVVAAELARWQLPATMFLTTGFVGGRSPGGDRMLSWNGIRELVDAGHEIGAHSVTHPQLDLLRSSAAEHEV